MYVHCMNHRLNMCVADAFYFYFFIFYSYFIFIIIIIFLKLQTQYLQYNMKYHLH